MTHEQRLQLGKTTSYYYYFDYHDYFSFVFILGTLNTSIVLFFIKKKINKKTKLY